MTKWAPARLGICMVWLAILAAFGTGDSLARDIRVIPQVADASGIIRTKIDISNLSATVPITRLKLFFFQSDGTPWALRTNLGNSNEFLLELGRSQVVRVETLAQSGGPNSGYAILRSYEGNASDSLDYQVSVSVFYEVLNGARVTDTVAVGVLQPTLRWAFPVDIDSTKNIYSGFSIVNLANEPNVVTLQLWSAFTPSSADASDAGRVTITLQPGQKRAQFLNEPGLFSSVVSFRGTLTGNSDKPVAVTALLQTQTDNGVQYATLAPAFLDSQRMESYVFLPESSHLDADVPTVPFRSRDDSRSFDVLYQLISPEVHYLVPENGAQLAAIGVKSQTEFETLTADDLQALTFRPSQLDVTDVSGNMVSGYSFAIRTSLGWVAKARVAQVVQTAGRKDLVLQVYVYR